MAVLVGEGALSCSAVLISTSSSRRYSSEWVSFCDSKALEVVSFTDSLSSSCWVSMSPSLVSVIRSSCSFSKLVSSGSCWCGNISLSSSVVTSVLSPSSFSKLSMTEPPSGEDSSQLSWRCSTLSTSAVSFPVAVVFAKRFSPVSAFIWDFSGRSP